MKKMVWLAVVVLVGCAGVFAGGSKEKTTVTIKDIDSISMAGIWLFEELPVGTANTALNSYIISDNILTVGLTFTNKKKGNTYGSNKVWQGKGDFYIAIVPIVDNSYQMHNALLYVGNGNKPIKYSFNNDELVTLSFSEFRSYPYSEFVSDFVTDKEKLASIQGSWRHTNPQAQGATYTFSGDKFTFTVNDGRDPISGNVKISGNKLCLIVSNEQFQIKYIDIEPNISIFINEDFFWMGNLDLYWGSFIKQPFGGDLVSNEEELAKIQGSWKHTNRKANGATYTFSGDKFTFTVNDGRDPISGTIKIANNKLCLIVSDELFQVKYIDIKPNKSIFINQDALLMGNLDLYWGPFQKQ